MELIEQLKNHNLLHPWMQILDVGCGDGTYSNLLTQYGSVDALDVVDEMTDKSNVHFIHENLRFFKTDKTYDLIFARNVFFITRDPIAHAQRYAEFLKPGGIFCLTFMGNEDPWVISPPEGIFRCSVTMEQVKEFMQPFETIYFFERKEEHATKGGNMKKWHLYELVLRKK